MEAGMVVEVHSSLSRLGWVCGGSVAVVQALMDVVTEEGTLVMPTQTVHYTDPAKWRHPPVPPSWLSVLYEQMPAFDPRVTPSRLMGQIAEIFRTWPGVVRSNHPMVSFAAWGKHAQIITTNHSLDYGLGEGSPLARIYDLDGFVLLLGASWTTCTSLHLAEYRARNPTQTTERSPILEEGKRVWRTYQDIELDTTQFLDIAGEFESEYADQDIVKTAYVGSALARLFPQRLAVDAAVKWIEQWNPLRQEASEMR